MNLDKKTSIVDNKIFRNQNDKMTTKNTLITCLSDLKLKIH